MTILSEQNHPPLCNNCGINLCAKHGISKLGYQKYRSICASCHRATKPNHRYKAHKKDKCDECGFIPKHPCQLDVDHIDGNNDNNLQSNLQTLCSNCHRLKTWLKKENCNKKWRVSPPSSVV
jgi:hypothetical protein